MNTLGLDLAGAPEVNRSGSRAIRGTLAERAFAAMFPHWDLTTYGRLHLAVPRGTPVIAGDSLSAVIGTISGAAVRDRCPNGTGWPDRGTR